MRWVQNLLLSSVFIGGGEPKTGSASDTFISNSLSRADTFSFKLCRNQDNFRAKEHEICFAFVRRIEGANLRKIAILTVISRIKVGIVKMYFRKRKVNSILLSGRNLQFKMK
jgi:hypothetical protein